MQDLLLQSIRRTHKNVTLHKVALGSKDEELDLHVPAGNVGAGSLIGTGINAIKCRVRRLDDIIKSEQIAKVHLMKIDVGGSRMRFCSVQAICWRSIVRSQSWKQINRPACHFVNILRFERL
jgi:hypothetical protein